MNKRITEFISNNPYRVLGLPTNTPDASIASAGNAHTPRIDIPKYLTSISPSAADVAKATATLKEPNARLQAKLSWLVYDKTTDRKALALARQEKLSEAIAHLKKAQDVANQHNLMIFLLVLGKYHKAVMIAHDIIKNHLDEYAKLLNLSDSDRELLPNAFLDLLAENIITEQVVYAVADIDSWSDYIVDSQSEKLRAIVNGELEKFAALPAEQYLERLEAAKVLYTNTSNAIRGLRALQTSHKKCTDNYKNAADSIATEILQAGIDYANHFDSSYDAPIKAMAAIKLAANIADSNLLRDRCAYNIQTLQEQIDRLPPDNAKEEVRNVNNAIRRISLSDRRISDAELFVNRVVPQLNIIKRKCDGNFYTRLSTTVCNEVIKCINNELNKMDNDPVLVFEKEKGNISALTDAVRRAADLNDTIGRLGMTYEMRNGAYTKSRTYVRNICEKYSIALGKQSVSVDDMVIVIVAVALFFLFIVAFVKTTS